MSVLNEVRSLISVPNSGKLLFLVLIASTAVLLLAYFLTLRLGATREIPKAHPLAAYTPFWIAWIRYKQRENRTVQAAHEKYGPIVQLAPNEVSINCVEDGLRPVYGSGQYEKHDWYQSLWNHGAPNMVAFQNRDQHSARKRMLSNIYSKSYILKSPVLAAQAHTLLYETMQKILHEHATTGKTLNLYYIISAASMDVSSAFVFGLRNSSNLLSNPREMIRRIDEHQSRIPTNFFVQEYPWLWNWLQWAGIPIWPRDVVRQKNSFEAWAFDMGTKAERQVLEDQRSVVETGRPVERPVVDTPVVYNQLRSSLVSSWRAGAEQGGKEKEKDAGWHTLTDEQRLAMAGELTDHLIAGFETTAAALTFLFYELATNPTLQSQLRNAINSVPRSPTHPTMPDPTALESLPLLHAVVLETLRLYPPVAGAQARVTPSPTVNNTTVTTLAGHSVPLPPGIRISARCYTLHRNPVVFPSPESFNPHRWLDPQTGEIRRTDAQAKKMHAWFWAFGSGGRMCLGSHLAMRDMKAVVAALVGRGWGVGLVGDGTGDRGGVRAWDQYVGGPVERVLDVGVWRVGDGEGNEDNESSAPTLGKTE